MWRGGEEGGRVSREFSRNFCKGWRRIGVRLGGNVGLGRSKLILVIDQPDAIRLQLLFPAGKSLLGNEKTEILPLLIRRSFPLIPRIIWQKVSILLVSPSRGKIGRRRKGKFLSLNILRYEFFSFFFPPCKLSRERRIYPSGVIRGWYIFSSFSFSLSWLQSFFISSSITFPFEKFAVVTSFIVLKTRLSEMSSLVGYKKTWSIIQDEIKTRI